MKLKIAYFGTPDFSARLLEKILQDKDLPVEVVLVVTQPDKPQGRKQILTPSPVKKVAKKYNIEIHTLDSGVSRLSRDPQNDVILASQRRVQNLKSLKELLALTDLCLLYAFGEIIPPALLKAPKHGFWNIHPSLLPKYRGASPIAYPLMLGDTETGVTLIQMDEELDHGPIIAQEKYTILPTDKRSDLEIKLTDLGYELFKKTITHNHPVISISPPVISIRQLAERDLDEIFPHSVRRNDNVFTEQNHTLATHSRRLTKQDGYIPLPVLKKALNNEPLIFDELPSLLKPPRLDSSNNDSNEPLEPPRFDKIEKDRTSGVNVIKNSSKIIYNLFRGLYPWPGLWTLLPGGKRLKITDMSLAMLHASSASQRIILHINRVQLEGKQEADFGQFQKVYNVF